MKVTYRGRNLYSLRKYLYISVFLFFILYIYKFNNFITTKVKFKTIMRQFQQKYIQTFIRLLLTVNSETYSFHSDIFYIFKTYFYLQIQVTVLSLCLMRDSEISVKMQSETFLHLIYEFFFIIKLLDVQVQHFTLIFIINSGY